MTASAACGRPVQQVGLTETRVAVRSLRRVTNPTSASLRRWCEQVDWLMPESLGQLAHRHRAASAATACSSRTRIGSARQANHAA